ncbi:aldo-keto reductase family 1 member B1-like [Adelges cooleyi]|uniref:aldo-keto reductase family 1 member B1-like n=1 Tax=Adelges cooleyi TaxID=133065 RepID=UPI00217F6E42|nr:aldo-keto reductase family 1 member B1-like [Adelges cooleyi]XP_050420525.1 aldo-keto reductase family 1 member B1-like [Adelges cooleyi]XP_050420526.1 aldo-keto reductase family 1 member B1-like [Adelges cooleyi]
MSVSKLVKMVKFNNGHVYPSLGLGTWQATATVDESGQQAVYEAVKSAIDIGYRHIDGAYIYNNEKAVGRAIKDKIKEGAITRDDMYITSKLWNDKHEPELVQTTLKDTLKDLGLDHVDLYLIHWPFSQIKDSDDNLVGIDIPITETWKAMEGCVKAGLTKSIGLSNFNIRQVKAILEVATIKPVVNQVESHPYLTQKKLKEFCDKNDIRLTAYGPLGSPKRSWADQDELAVLEEPVVKKIAENHKKTAAQILIKFQLQRGLLVIPKSANPERQKLNMDVWDFELSEDEIKELEFLDKNIRYFPFISAKDLKEYPFHEEA